MGLEIIEQELNPSLLQQDLDDFDEEDGGAKPMSVDARRKLEDKIEELRLMREMKEFDFDG